LLSQFFFLACPLPPPIIPPWRRLLIGDSSKDSACSASPFTFFDFEKIQGMNKWAASKYREEGIRKVGC